MARSPWERPPDKNAIHENAIRNILFIKSTLQFVFEKMNKQKNIKKNLQIYASKNE